MNPLADLVRGRAADIIARFGTPVSLARPAGPLDAAAQAVAPGEIACRVPAILHRRTGRGDGRTVATVEAYIAGSALAAAGFPAPPRPGDRLTLDGALHPVLAVETLSAGLEPALHVLRVGR